MKIPRNAGKLICLLFLIFIIFWIAISIYFADEIDPEDKFYSSLLENEYITGIITSRPGIILSRLGVTKKHPVVLVPGIVSTGLEIWKGK